MICAQQAISQTDPDSVVNRIYSACIDFMIKRNELKDTNNIDYYNGRMIIVEIVKKSVLGFAETGVYILGKHTSHSHNYLLLKSGAEFKILLFEDLAATLNDTIDFLSMHKISCETIMLYIREINYQYKFQF